MDRKHMPVLFFGTTSERNAHTPSAAPAFWWDTDEVKWYIWDGTSWSAVGSGSGSLPTPEQDKILVGGSSSWDVSTFSDAVLSGFLLGTPTNDTFGEVFTHVFSAGIFTGGALSDNGDGTVAVSAGAGMIRTGPDSSHPILLFDWQANSSVSLTDNAFNYVYVDYNSGSPTISATTDHMSLDHSSQFVLGSVYRDGTSLYIIEVGQELDDFVHNNFLRGWETERFTRVSGIVTSESGTRNIAVTPGVFYASHQRFTTSAIDTSGTDTFTYYYRDGSGGWTKVTGQTQIDNQHYDDGSGTLASLTSNRYGVHWVFMLCNGELAVVYGVGDYTLADAKAADIPASLPGVVQDAGFIIAKIIIRESGTSFYSVELPWATFFEGSLITDHGALAGLGDDDHTQYLLADGSRQLTNDWDAGDVEIRARTFYSDVSSGAPPFTVNSPTVVYKLNADRLDGYHAWEFVQTTRQVIAGDGLTGGGSLSADVTIALGTPDPLSVSSIDDVTETSHTHAIIASSNPGATSSLLKTDGSGFLVLNALGINESPSYSKTLVVNTGLSGVTVNIAGQPNGSIVFGNISTLNTAPTIVGKSDNRGFTFIAATNDSNTFGDFRINVRENDNSDFATTTSAALIVDRYTTRLLTLLRNGRLGLGTASPDGRLHVHSASAGSVTAHSYYDDLVVENNVNAGISVLSPDSNYAGILFGSPSNNYGALVRWRYATKTMRIGPIDPSGILALMGAGYVESARVDASRNFVVGTTSASPNPRLYVSQNSSSLAPLGCSQGNASGPMLYLRGRSGSSYTLHTGSPPTTNPAWVKVYVYVVSGGLSSGYYYIPLYQ